MSNNNQRHWYRGWKVMIPILAAIIGGIFVLFASFPQTPTTPLFKEMGGDTDTDGDYEISWESSKRAIKYILQEDSNPAFTSPRTVYTGSETKKHIYGKSDGDYYYRVMACNNAGESEWSPIRKMTVIISPPLTPTPIPIPIPIPIPLTAGWKAQGPGAIGKEYKDGILELKASLHGGDDYAELFLDLRGVRLPEIERNPDGTYNLADTELIAVVRSDQDFKGDPNHPNGAQFLLKNKQWDNLIGTWLNINDAMMSPAGMEIFFMVPNNKISREVAGISLKFTIGSNSKETYEGSFFVQKAYLILQA